MAVELIDATQDGRGIRVLLLEEGEASPPQDTVRIERDGEPLVDLTPSEVADMALVLAQSAGILFRQIVMALDELCDG